jgi:hypothetical protein
VCSGQFVENNSILSFSEDDVSWTLAENGLLMIYEREVYIEIFELLCTGDLKKMLVIGTPGIGKSVLEFYLMYRLAKFWKDSNDGKVHSILYKPRSSETNPIRYLLETDGTEHRVYLVPCIVHIQPDYYFTNTYSDMNFIPTKTILHVTSPGSRGGGTREFEKSLGVLIRRNLGDQVTMLPFSWDEAQFLLFIINQLNIKKNKSEITYEEFQFMFWIFGGSARLLSSEPQRDTPTNIQEFVETEMNDFFDGITTNDNVGMKEAFAATWESCCKLISSILSSAGRGQISAEFVTLSMFKHVYYGELFDWASPFMKYLAGAIVDDHNDNVLNELKSLFNNSNSAMDALFERCAIKEILTNFKNGQRYICDKLRKSKYEKKTNWVFEGTFTRKVIINKIEDIQNMQSGEFGVPNIPNFALVDLVYKGEDNELILFNMYYGDGKKHKGAVDNLIDIQNANNGPNVKDKMIFVLKSENTTFEFQDDLKTINQYRMDYNLSRVGTKHKLDHDDISIDHNTGNPSSNKARGTRRNAKSRK